MIKTIQLLKDSLMTYKLNFKNIFTMAWPIVLLTIVAQYYAFDLNKNMQTGQFNILYIVFASMIYFVSMLAISLFLTPAISRSIQKNEDNGVFNVKEGYSFQKKNIWKFVMVNIWGFLYIFKRLLPYIVVSATAVLMTVYFNFSESVNYALMVISIASMIIGVILNITRFVLYKNIFFSKDSVSPKDAVKESMSLGVNKMKDIWKIILAMIILAIVVEILVKIFNALSITGLYGLIVGSIVMIMFSMPYMLIIASKGYVMVRGGSVEVSTIEKK
jgi:hypothetical protein